MRKSLLIISLLFFLTGLSSNGKSPKIPKQAEIRFEDMTIVDVYYSNCAAYDTIVCVPEYRFLDTSKSRFLYQLLKTMASEDGMSWRFINRPTSLSDSVGRYYEMQSVFLRKPDWSNLCGVIFVDNKINGITNFSSDDFEKIGLIPSGKTAKLIIHKESLVSFDEPDSNGLYSLFEISEQGTLVLRYLTDWYYNNISNEKLLNESRSFDWINDYINKDPSKLVQRHSSFDLIRFLPEKKSPTIVIDFIDEDDIKSLEDKDLPEHIYYKVYKKGRR